MKWLALPVAVGAMLVAACGGSGESETPRPISPDRFAQVQRGMSIAEVEQLLGGPHKTSVIEDDAGRYEVWFYYGADPAAGNYQLTFDPAGKVGLILTGVQ